jgi:hypothetical protein
MKKNILISILAGAFLLVNLPSCTDLSEKVYDKLPAESFGTTSAEIKGLMGTVFMTLKRYSLSGRYIYLSENGGSCTVTPTRIGGDWYDGGQYREMYMHSWNAATNCILDSWNAATQSIGTCNATIFTLENASIPDAQKAEYVASVRGVRAFWVYVMLDNWGSVPLLTDYTIKDLPELKSRQETYEWLIQEITEIAEQCPAGTYDNYGKFTKGAAYFLLSKLYLNAAAWGVNVSNAYQNCISACDKIMNMGYILEPNWGTNFGAADKSREGILTAIYDESDTQWTAQLMLMTLHYADNRSDGALYAAWNGITTQPGYVKLFDLDDPRRTGTFRIGERRDIQTGEMLKTGQGENLIYTVDMEFIQDSQRDGGPWGDVRQYMGARCQKWPYTSTLSNAMGNDFHLFRLADVYLTKAEALLRSGGSVADATNLVNAIRGRAFGNNNHNYTTMDLAKIQLERRLELAWECWSRQDDIRFGCFEQGMWPASNCPRATGEHLKLYPIPQNAYQSNQKLVQNPGYAAFH